MPPRPASGQIAAPSSTSAPPVRPIGNLPSIAIVTPSFNQAPYLEAALLSVLEQDYPRLAYAVMDGGSEDGSAEIIRRHAGRLAAWRSAPDGGQYAAVAEGFARTEGEILGWLNSDDLYCPWAFSVVGEIFAQFPEMEWLTTARPLFRDGAGRVVDAHALPGFARAAFLAGEHLPRAGRLALGFVQQESTFWRRSLWERAGPFDERYPLAGDFALWSRFFEHAPLYAVETPLGSFRRHGGQKTSRALTAYLEEAERALAAAGGRRRGRAWEAARELARRAPAAAWPALAGAGLLHRTQTIAWDDARQAWRMHERYV